MNQRIRNEQGKGRKRGEWRVGKYCWNEKMSILYEKKISQEKMETGEKRQLAWLRKAVENNMERIQEEVKSV